MGVLSNSFSIVLSLVGVVFFLAGYMLLRFPPKKINSWYGYRTKSSMRNQERWDFAQKYSGIESLRLGVIYIVIAVVGLFVPMPTLLQDFLHLPVMLAFIILMIVRVEKAIKQEFGENKY